MNKIGRYEIVEQIGQGAMGVVYKASDPTIGRQVAIKVVSLNAAQKNGDPDTTEIFMREARAAGRLSHPGIVTIHDALEDSESRSGYIVMEFIPGRTLDSIVASGESPSLERCLDIVRQIAEALDYAHGQQVIHRDLKPANIILTEDGRVKIMDFGIAKIMTREGTRLDGAVMGTPSYMSSEQVTGRDVDARSDLFSLGIIAYFLLTGRKPFAGDAEAVMFKIAYEDPVLPSRVNPKLTVNHDYVLLRCLAKDRDKRYATAREVIDDLDDIQNGRPPRSQAGFPAEELRAGEPTLVSAKAVPDVAARSNVPAAQTQSSWPTVGVAMTLAGLLAFGVWTSRRSTPGRLTGSLTGPLTSSVQAVPAASPVPHPPPATPSGSTPAQGAPDRVLLSKQIPPDDAKGSSASPKRTARPQRPRSTEELAKPPTAAQSMPAQATGPKESEAHLTGPSPLTPPAQPDSQPSLPVTVASRAVQLVCHHQLRQATLTISVGAQSLLQWPLRGTKRGGFLGIKAGYAGTLSRSIKIPAGARELSVHVVSTDGSADLSQTISASPPSGALPTLQVSVTTDQLTLNWLQRGLPQTEASRHE